MGWNRGNIVLILKRYGNTFDKKKKKKQNHSTLKGKLEGSQQENKQTNRKFWRERNLWRTAQTDVSDHELWYVLF